MNSAPEIDDAFLDRVRLREPEAVAQTVREHARPLFRAARAMGFSPTEAEDLVQDVFVTFLEKVAGFEGRSLLRTWLFGVLHRKCMERRRAAIVESHLDPIDEVFEARFDTKGSWIRPPQDLERLLLSKELGQAIDGCSAGLAASQREAFVLREVEGLDTPEICKILGVSVTNLGVLLFRARARLRECLEASGLGRK